MLEMTSLPAKQGDAIWIRWGEEANPHQIIVDMGTGAIGKYIRQQIEVLPADNRHIDLLVITHVDADHIGGVLTCLAEADAIPGVTIGDIWFNGFEHLTGQTVITSPGIEPLGPVQGEKLSFWLRDQAWNKAFEGKPVKREPNEAINTVSFHDGLKLSVLGPTQDRLSALTQTWQEDVKEAIEKGRLDGSAVSPGLEPLGTGHPPDLGLPDDLLILAEEDDSSDTSKANGSSIALLLEYKGRKILLAGDAYSEDLIEGIQAFSPGERLHVDVFKLPHHGSKNNVHTELIESLDCDRWLISTDGTRFRHPDNDAIARIISFGSAAKPVVSFNVKSDFNKWWDNEDWMSMYQYDVEYGDSDAGLTLSFELDD